MLLKLFTKQPFHVLRNIVLILRQHVAAIDAHHELGSFIELGVLLLARFEFDDHVVDGIVLNRKEVPDESDGPEERILLALVHDAEEVSFVEQLLVPFVESDDNCVFGIHLEPFLFLFDELQ